MRRALADSFKFHPHEQWGGRWKHTQHYPYVFFVGKGGKFLLHQKFPTVWSTHFSHMFVVPAAQKLGKLGIPSANAGIHPLFAKYLISFPEQNATDSYCLFNAVGSSRGCASVGVVYFRGNDGALCSTLLHTISIQRHTIQSAILEFIELFRN